MERRFSLKECLLVPRYERIEHTYERMAGAAGDLIGRVLRDGSALGVSWGGTMRAIGENLSNSLPPGRVDVVPTIGAMGKIETGIYPNSIARAFAEKLGGDAYLVNTPAIVDTPEIRDSLMADLSFSPIRDMWQKLDMAFLGVSNLDESSAMYRSGLFTKDELALMRTSGGVCASNFIVFDEAGQVVATPISERIVCLSAEGLRTVRNVVVTAAGPSKTEPLRALLRSGLCTMLITDIECARDILAGS